MLTYTPLGAAGMVTGSLHIFEYSHESQVFRFGIDAGMFQTGESLSQAMLNANLGYDVSSVDAWILTHAHLDHSGRLPMVVKRGFGGPIFATKPTQELASIIQFDAVVQMRNTFLTLEEENLSSMEKGGLPISGLERKDIELYSDMDVEQTSKLYQEIQVGKEWYLHPNLKIDTYEASHILGAISLRITEISTQKVLFFSGDIGFGPKPFLKRPTKQQPESNLTTIITESTYGNRIHASTNPMPDLGATISTTLKRNGIVIIPSFAVQRTQELLWYCVRMQQSGQIPKTKIYVDSPMAIQANEVYARYSTEAAEIISNSSVAQLVTSEQSKELNYLTDPCIIIAGSGMLNGGRIWQHIRFHGATSKNSIIIVGYQAEGTHGRELLEGKKNFVIKDKEIAVRAEVTKIEGFSGHADQSMIIAMIKDLTTQPVVRGQQSLKIILVHGEDDARSDLKQKLMQSIPSHTITIELPSLHQVLTIWS